MERSHPADRIVHIGLSLFVVSTGWTSALALSDRVRVPVVAVVGLAVLFAASRIVSGRAVRLPKTFGLGAELSVVFAALCFCFVASSSQQKNAWHLAAYALAFFVYYYLVLVICVSTGYRVEQLARAMAWTAALVCGLGLVEFLLLVLKGIWLGDYLHHVNHELVTNGGALLPASARIRSTTEEPGYLALLINSVGVMGLGHVWSRGYKVRTAYLALLAGTLLLTASAAGIVAAGVAAAGGYLVFFRRVRLIAMLGTVCGVGAAGVVAVWLQAGLGSADLTDILAQKLGLLDASGVQRFEQWEEGWELVSFNPFASQGLGAAMSTRGISYLSWYLSLAVESSVWTAMLVMGMIVRCLTRALRVPGTWGYLCFIAVFAAAMHYVVISTFYQPFFWTVLVATNLLLLEAREELRAASAVHGVTTQGRSARFYQKQSIGPTGGPSAPWGRRLEHA
jgi:hypothetical protein